MTVDPKIIAKILFSFRHKDDSGKSPKETLADFVIDCIKNKTISKGYEFPSVATYAKNINYSIYMVSEAFKLMSERKYLKIQNGKNAIATDPDEDPSLYIKPIVHFHGSSSCFRHFGHTSKIKTKFQKDKEENLKIAPPGEQNSVCVPFFDVLCNLYNTEQQMALKTDSLYYTHNLQEMVRGIVSMLELKNRVVLVPETGYELVVHELQLKGITVRRVAVDHDGYNTGALNSAFDKFDVGVLVTATNGNFPFLTDTPKDKIRIIFDKHQKKRFYILEMNFGGPAQSLKKNGLLGLSGDAIGDIIYIWQPSYYDFDSCQICAVAATPDKISNIRSHIKANGKNAVESIAYATSEMFKRRGFSKIENLMAAEMLRFKEMVIDVFGSPGFWDMDGIKNGSLVAICLIPLRGALTRKKIDQLKEIGIISVDPGRYTAEGTDDIVCIRFEMAYYVEIKTCRELLMWVNQNCINAVTGAPLVLFS